MGKAQVKKKTSAARRHNPVRVPDAHLGGGRAEGKANPNKEKQMLPVLAKLRSPEYADRTWACAAICNLIQNDAATRRLFQGKNVVGELIERLSDSVDEVVVEASGALRNLAIDGGHELCSEMYNKGVMTHIVTLMGKISSTIDAIVAAPPENTLSDEDLQARKHVLNLAENVIVLIWSLAEASHKTLAAVNAAGCEGLLVKVLAGREALGLGVTLAAAQALYALTQDNVPFNKALLSHPEALPTLVAIAREDHTAAEKDKKGKGKSKSKKNAMDEDVAEEEIGDGRALLTRVLVAGSLRNVVHPGSRTDEAVGISALTSEVILPLVNSLLDVNLANVVERVSTLATQVPAENVPVVGKDLKTDHRSPAELKLERIERMLTTVSTALEVLTGICAGLEDIEIPEADQDADGLDEDGDMDMEDGMDDEALIEMGRDPAMDGEGSGAGPQVQNAGSLPHLLGTLGLPSRLSSLAVLTPLSFPPNSDSPSIHPPTTSALSIVHLRALEALNNLLLATAATVASASPSDASQLGGLIPTQAVWLSLFSTISDAGSDASALRAKGQEMRIEVIEAALGGVWGLAKATPAQLAVTDVQVQMLMDVIPALNSEVAKTRVVETLAAIASRPGVGIDENKFIASWLLNSLISSSADTEAVVALINAIIDIYADETRDYDTVFVSGNYTKQLASVVARVRSQVRKVDRRKQPELRGRGEEAYENLVAFIRYRRSL